MLAQVSLIFIRIQNLININKFDWVAIDRTLPEIRECLFSHVTYMEIDQILGCKPSLNELQENSINYILWPQFD